MLAFGLALLTVGVAFLGMSYFNRWRRAGHAQLWQAIHALQEAEMATQADVDAVTAQVATVSADLAKAQTDIQAEIDKLAAANPAVSLDALNAAVAQLDPAVQTLDKVAPTPKPGP